MPEPDLSTNPYAPPKYGPDRSSKAGPPPGVAGEPLHSAEILRDGSFLLVREGAQQPPVCPATGQPLVQGAGVQILYWRPRWLWICLLAGSAVGLIPLLLCQKKIGGVMLSPEAMADLRRRQILGGTFVLVALIGSGLAQDFGPWMVPCLVLMTGNLTAGIWLILRAAPLRVTGYRNGWLRIAGCAPAFLQRLDEGSFEKLIGQEASGETSPSPDGTWDLEGEKDTKEEPQPGLE